MVAPTATYNAMFPTAWSTAPSWANVTTASSRADSPAVPSPTRKPPCMAAYIVGVTDSSR
jgi:hypothetical protein